MTLRTERAINLLTDQFKGKKRIKALVTALLKPGSSIEKSFQDLAAFRMVDAAFGVQLDGLGEIVGVDRRGRGDSSYRAAIKFQIFINVSKGQPNVIIEAAESLSGGDVIRYWENYPAGFQIYTDGPNVLDVTQSVIQEFDISVTNPDGQFLLIDDDDNQLVFRTAFDNPLGLAEFLEGMSPVGITPVIVIFSLGIDPVLGFGRDFEPSIFVDDDNQEIYFDDGSQVELITAETQPLGDFGTFGELAPETLAWDDESPVYFNVPPLFKLAVNTPSGEFALVDNNGDEVYVNDSDDSELVETIIINQEGDVINGGRIIEAMYSQ